MRTVKKAVLLLLVLCLAACGVNSLGFNHLNYPVQGKRLLGKIVLIVPSAEASKQFTLPAKPLGIKDDQIVSAGQMLIKIADYAYPKRFTAYERVSSMSKIKPGFYRVIMRLAVTNFTVSDHQVFVTIQAKIFSYQGRSLYEKAFVGKAALAQNLQLAALQAYRSAFDQINKRLTQVLYWEQHASLGKKKVSYV